MLQQLDLDIFGLAETFLRKGEEPQVGGYISGMETTGRHVRGKAEVWGY